MSEETNLSYLVHLFYHKKNGKSLLTRYITYYH